MAGIIENARRIRHTLLPLPLKYGRRFRQVYSFLREHQHLSVEEVAEYQLQRLQALVDYAYHHVPFYRERLDKTDIHPGDIKSLEDFAKIPVLTKDEVEKNQMTLMSDEFEKLNPIVTATSATTRDFLQTYRSAETELWRRAVVWRHYNNVGYRFREPRARLTTRLHFIKDKREMPIDYSENELLIDPTGINMEHSRKIHARMRDFAPKMLICQPSNVAILTHNFRHLGLEPFHIPIVFTLGERLYPEYRETIGSYFGCRLIDYYANRENTAAACQYSDDRMYIQTEYCHLEFLDEQGEQVTGKQGDIISSSLVNRAFPLIRYHTDDVGIYRGHPEGAAESFPVMEIVGGRGKDLILTKKGLRCPHLWYHMKENGFDRFVQVQTEQVSHGELVFRIIPKPDFRDAEDRRLAEKIICDYFDHEFKINIEVVDQIPATKGCKNRMVISDLAMNYLRQQSTRTT
jgi:phenylacetate-CoA ligase